MKKTAILLMTALIMQALAPFSVVSVCADGEYGAVKMVWQEEFNDPAQTLWLTGDGPFRSGKSYTITANSDGTATFTTGASGDIYSKEYESVYKARYLSTYGEAFDDKYVVETKITDVGGSGSDLYVGTEQHMYQQSLQPGVYYTVVNRNSGSESVTFYNNNGVQSTPTEAIYFRDLRLFNMYMSKNRNVTFDYIRVYKFGNSMELSVDSVGDTGATIITSFPIDISDAVFTATNGGNTYTSNNVSVVSFSENKYSVRFSGIKANKTYTIGISNLYTIDRTQITSVNSASFTTPAQRLTLFLDASGFDNLVDNANIYLPDVWSDFKVYLDELSSTPPTYYVDSNEEETWMRKVGDDIFKLVVGYKISGDSTYLDKATNYVNGVIAYPSWGRGETYLNNDLSCAHLLTALSLYYNWLYDNISSAQKTAVRNALYDRAGDMLELGWWEKSYLQNHLWICASSMAITAAAIKDDNPSLSSSLFNQAKTLYGKVFDYVSDEGSYHEGHMYTSYGLDYMLMYLDVAQNVFEYSVGEQPFLDNIGEFVVNLTLPQMKSGSGIDSNNFGDAPESDEATFVSNLAQLAGKYGQTELWKYINTYATKTLGKRSLWKLLMSYDADAVAASSGTAYFANDKLYPDLGYCFSRTGWNTEDSVLAFKCGIPLGTKSVGWSLSNLGTGHVHPDQNSFLLTFDGQRIIDDDGYAKAYTSNHNTLSINGVGQYYEGSNHSDWKTSPAKYATPEITAYQAEDGYMYAVGDATDAYISDCKLEKYKRHFVYIKPNILIVLDDAKVIGSASAKDMQLNFFTPLDYCGSTGTNSFAFKNKLINLNVKTIGDGTASVTTKNRTKDKSDGTREENVLQINKNGRVLTRATAFTWGKKWTELPNVDLDFENGKLYIDIASDSVYTETTQYIVDIANETLTKNVNKNYTFDVGCTGDSFSVAGTLPFGVYNDVVIEVKSPFDATTYINNIQATAGSFTSTIPVRGLVNGEYVFRAYNREFEEVLTKRLMIKVDVEVTNLQFNTIGSSVTCDISLYNDTEATKVTTVFLARYNNSGNELLECDIKRVSLASGESQNRTLRLDGIQATDAISVFVWDNGMKPILVPHRTYGLGE